MSMPSIPSDPAPLPYRGRFAPTPSGPLHLGSLLTALAGWLQARAVGGEWLLRIDDLDRPRCVPGADTVILQQLEAHGLQWHGQPRYQSQHLDEYRNALNQLIDQGALYGCRCTRATLQQSALPGPDDLIYPGTCRSLQLPLDHHALRLRIGSGMLCLDDAWQGMVSRDLANEIGDFTLRRSDGVIGYQLACVVDEREQGITEVVRGADLLGSSLRQQHLALRLGLTPPRYRHVPVLLEADGRKLSKQNHVPALDAAQASCNLWRCLQWLQQQPPQELRHGSSANLLEWALTNWEPEKVPALRSLQVEPPL